MIVGAFSREFILVGLLLGGLGIIGISIAYGYTQARFLVYLRRLLELALLFGLLCKGIVISIGILADWAMLIAFLIFAAGVFVLSALDESGKWSIFLGFSLLPGLEGARVILPLIDPYLPIFPVDLGEWLVGLVILIPVGAICSGVGAGGAALGKRIQVGSRIERIGSRVKEAREEAREKRARYRAKMREYEVKLKQWEAEGYDVSELKRKWFGQGV
ncbi:MAG: hypothetical protein DDT30_02041 [Dehalococcoidia bacterium]|nr:hypothetical protein [Bacillota bacterium]